MTNRLVRSNRNVDPDDLKPANVAKATDFTNLSQKKISEEKDTSKVSSITFDTNLKITNHTRNKLQALAVLGYTENQKKAVDLIFSAYLETLTPDEQKEVMFQIAALEKRDIRNQK